MNEHLPSRAIRQVPNYLPAEHFGALEGSQSIGDVELREYFGVILRYRVLILALILASILLAVIYVFTATPLYTATSKVRIGTYEPVLTATKIEDMLQQKSKETNYLETQLEEMESYSLADKVLQDPTIHGMFSAERRRGFFARIFAGMGDKEEEAAPQNGPYQAALIDIKRYLAAVEIKPVRRTSIANISATVPSAQLAALIANRHAQAYIDWVRSTRIEQQARGLQFLRSQADELREKVADLERELADYAEANSIVALNKDENITVKKMTQLNDLLTASTGKRIEAENFYKEAKAALESPSAGFDDQSTQSMRSDLAKLESEYGQLGQKFTPEYPKMRQLASQIEELKKSIEGQRRQIVIGLKSRAQAAAEEEKKLHEELEQQKSQAFELSKRQVQYNVLNRDLTSSRELLQNVLRQVKETSLAVESNASNVSIVDLAVAPLGPTYPRKKLIVLLGLVLGSILGLGIAFLLKYLDNTVRTPEQLALVAQIPSLGVVPSFLIERDVAPEERQQTPETDGGVESLNALVSNVQDSGTLLPIPYLSDPKSLVAEAYRTIRTGLLLSQAGEPPRTILVSSAQSSEGKTTSSINLAACLASSGGRVVLVDADLRRPSVGKTLGLDHYALGLTEVLTGQASVLEVENSDKLRNLAIIPSGRIPPNPAELLGSLEMARLLDDLGSRYDYVIIDSPPVLPVADSVILSRYVDGVVLVVKGGVTPRKVVRDAKLRLQAVGARFLGAILNEVDVTSGDYYYYNRYYYSYYQHEKRPHEQRAAGSA